MEPNGILFLLLLMTLYIAVKTGFIGMALLIQNAKPDFIDRASINYRKRPRRWIILLGLINAFAIPFIALLLISTQVLALPGFALLLAYLWLALLSYTVIYRDIAANILEDFGPNPELKQTLYGGLIAEAAFFTPILGQAWSTLLFIRALGAVIMTALGRYKITRTDQD